jgi:hypothetical protein
MTYIERANQVASESQLAVQVLLSSGNDDIEFIRLTPQSNAPYISPEAFAARKLRDVGVVGLCGTQAACVFKEDLGPVVVGAIGTAFAEYIHVLLGDSIAAQLKEHQKGDEVNWLEQLHCLPDARMN